MSSETVEKKPGAIPFITFNQSTKKFDISPESVKIITNPEYKKIGIISLVGKYRTGKSFLLNRVLIKSQKGFEVGPTIKPCTKGIWLWPTPIFTTNNFSEESFPVFFIDTEGLGAYDEEVNHDSKIFLISILISSLFIYNSFGTIDENSINSLSLILNLSKNLKLRNSSLNNTNNNNSEEKEMSKYFPSLLWLLRDFILKLEDSEGNVITAKQYLENALMIQKGTSAAIEEKNEVRNLLKTYFKERDCFIMVRPVENENDLQNLQNLPDDKIRKEFLEQSEVLRTKVFKKIKPKTFNGKLLTGSMLMKLIENIINSINEGAIPVIENSWKYVLENELLREMNLILFNFKEKIRKYQSENINSDNFHLHFEKFTQNEIENEIKKFTEMNKQNISEKELEDYQQISFI